MNKEDVQAITFILVFALAFAFVLGYFVAWAKVEPKIIEKEVVQVEYLNSAADEVQVETWKPLGVFEITAYCACQKCCGKYPDHPEYGITATGTQATQGRTIAVDPNVIPLGSEVIIEGDTFIAEDTGSAIKGKRIDVYISDHDTALCFGVQSKDVFVRG